MAPRRIIKCGCSPRAFSNFMKDANVCCFIFMLANLTIFCGQNETEKVSQVKTKEKKGDNEKFLEEE